MIKDPLIVNFEKVVSSSVRFSQLFFSFSCRGGRGLDCPSSWEAKFIVTVGKWVVGNCVQGIIKKIFEEL